jgi:hypothetical protein
MMFNAGDKQALLWAIDECAQTVVDQRSEAQPIPKWAAEAIIDKIYRGVTGEFATWDDAFDKIYQANRRVRIKHLALMLKVWVRICQLDESRTEELFVKVGKEFKIGATTVKEYWSRINKAISDDEWAPSSELLSLIGSQKYPAI